MPEASELIVWDSEQTHEDGTEAEALNALGAGFSGRLERGLRLTDVENALATKAMKSWLEDHPEADDSDWQSAWRNIIKKILGDRKKGEALEQKNGWFEGEAVVLEMLRDIQTVGGQLVRFLPLEKKMKKFLDEGVGELSDDLVGEYVGLLEMLPSLHSHISRLFQALDRMGSRGSDFEKSLSPMFIHDIKNPLAAALANAEFLVSGNKETSREGSFAAVKAYPIDKVKNDIVEPLTDLYQGWVVSASALTDDLLYRLSHTPLTSSDHRDITHPELRHFLEQFIFAENLEMPLMGFQLLTKQYYDQYRPTKEGPTAAPHVTMEFDALDASKINTFADIAVWLNLLQNILSNACSKDRMRMNQKNRQVLVKGIDGREVDVRCVQEQGSLVVTVADKGVGLRPSQLQPNSDSFIFKIGRSQREGGTESTGIGLKEPQYYTENNINVSVVSRRRGTPGNAYAVYSNAPSEEDALASLAAEAERSGASTIFEVRISLFSTNASVIRPVKSAAEPALEATV